VGGTVSTLLGWRWVFLFNLPIGLIVLAIGVLFLPDDGHRGFAQLDIVGLVLLSLGLGLGLFGISQGPAVGWTNEPVLISLAVGSVSLLAACWFELRTAQPLLDLRMFTSPVFTAASTVSVAAAMAFTGWVFLIAQFLQQVEGLSALNAGLASLPQMLGVIVGSALVSKLLVPRLGSRRTVDVGLAVVALSLFAEAAVLHSAPLWVLLVLFGITGVANPISFLTVMAAGFALTPPDELNRATALYNTIRQVGSALGVAVVTAVLVLSAGARDTHAVVSSPNAYRDGLIVLAVIAALGIAWTRHLSDADGVLDTDHILIIEAAG
jgi:predicted MFS family arabinose efflux permease